MHLQQSTFENIVAKGETTLNEQFSTPFNNYTFIVHVSFKEIFHNFVQMISKSSAADFIVCGKGL